MPGGPRSRCRAGSGRPMGGALMGLTIPAVLLLLSEHPYHGYALRDTLDTSGLVAEVDFGNLYRTLRRMETNGLVTSHWEQGDGPGRRVYSITDNGRRHLKDVVVVLRMTATSLNTFLTRYQRQEELIHHGDAQNPNA